MSESNLRIGNKIAIGFALQLMCPIMLGLFAEGRLAVVEGVSGNMRDVVLPRIEALGEINSQTTRFRQVELTVAMARDPQTRAENEVSLQAARTDTEKAFAAFDGPVGQNGQRPAASALHKAWDDYLSLEQQYLQALNANNAAAANTIYWRDLQGSFVVFGKSLQTAINQVTAAAATDSGRGSDLAAGGRFWILVALGATAIFYFLAGMGMIRRVASPLGEIARAMRRLAAGELETTVPSIGRDDEIGAMAGAMQVFRDTMKSAKSLAGEKEASRLQGEQRTGRLHELFCAFEAEIGGTVSVLASASTEMEVTARSMTGNAAETDSQANAVAQAAEATSSSVQTVAAASEQLSASIGEINRQVTASSALTNRVVSSVRRTNDTVRALSESADRIGKVVELINTIASQTNLLALNATIEAARAGDAGRGFAVVASEVKSLAQQTAKATGDIGGQIAQVQAATGGAVEAIREIATLIEEVSAITTSIAEAVEQQGAATTEIARNVQQTAVSTRVVTSSIGAVSQAANDTGTAASQVLAAAGDLSRQAEGLSGQMHRFITSMKTA